MKSKKLLCAALVVLSFPFALGQQYKVLYSFAGAQAGDGANPVSNLVLDRVGNLYGTTEFGGIICYGDLYCGTVFALLPNPDGTWTERTLYTFCSRSLCQDGALPTAGLVLDAAGNLYGTTTNGGAYGYGAVFELSPPSSPGAAWTETVLYSFCANNASCPDGAKPVSGLAMDASGNLYGTTALGGSGHDKAHNGGGIVFELSHGAGGWTEIVLYNFCSLGQGTVCVDGTFPQAGVTLDRLGNLYGTTEFGGNFLGFGTVYELSPGANGWIETVIATSKQSLAGNPLGTVSIDPLGNLYSTFSQGGQIGAGGVFRIGPHGGGTEFSFNGANGGGPTAGVLIDVKNHALYGTTSGGSSFFGTVFKMVAPAQLTVLYNFCSQPNCVDGVGPFASLIEDKSGNLYGTAKLGGTDNQGVVFEIVQSAPKQKVLQHPRVWHTILPPKKWSKTGTDGSGPNVCSRSGILRYKFPRNPVEPTCAL